jgi:diguanylate cyclase (GGDEF)-like protein
MGQRRAAEATGSGRPDHGENLMEALIEHDIETDIITLGFAARLLLTNLDRELIVERAAENLGDFGKSDNVGIFLLEPEGQLLCPGGLIARAGVTRSFRVPAENSPIERILADKGPDYFPLAFVEGIPVPCDGAGIEKRRCLCAPLIAANNQPIGLVTFDCAADDALPPLMMQSLLLLLTIVAVALETTRLFQMAVYDGLTGLYIRRYFDLRLAEEENRVRRYGGKTAILMLDIDHFKGVNDRYGHQTGDEVLREVARIVRSSVRPALDAACRYGGEELAVIMPDTDAAGALVAAERIRQRVESQLVEGPQGPFGVTLSGGIASMDQPGAVPRMELLRRADSALYRAKEQGRNRILLWQQNP